ncbi:hypothetical protein [Bacillus phage PK2]|nr:hypothetical protein [Bacillus phage PK2]
MVKQMFFVHMNNRSFHILQLNESRINCDENFVSNFNHVVSLLPTSPTSVKFNRDTLTTKIICSLFGHNQNVDSVSHNISSSVFSNSVKAPRRRVNGHCRPQRNYIRVNSHNSLSVHIWTVRHVFSSLCDSNTTSITKWSVSCCFQIQNSVETILQSFPLGFRFLKLFR